MSTIPLFFLFSLFLFFFTTNIILTGYPPPSPPHGSLLFSFFPSATLSHPHPPPCTTADVDLRTRLSRGGASPAGTPHRPAPSPGRPKPVRPWTVAPRPGAGEASAFAFVQMAAPASSPSAHVLTPGANLLGPADLSREPEEATIFSSFSRFHSLSAISRTPLMELLSKEPFIWRSRKTPPGAAAGALPNGP